MVQCSKQQVENQNIKIIEKYPPLCTNEGQKTLGKIFGNLAAVAELLLV